MGHMDPQDRTARPVAIRHQDRTVDRDRARIRWSYVGKANPMTYVAPPTITPASVISRPADHQLRSVTSDLAAPTRKCAIKETIAAAMIAPDPVAKMNGITGMIAPAAVLSPAAMAAWVALPGCS